VQAADWSTYQGKILRLNVDGSIPLDNPMLNGVRSRACKLDRIHTVIVVDGAGSPVRVTCDNCGSEHNYRGGARMATSGTPPATQSVPRTRRAAGEPFPIVSDRQRIAPAMTATSDDLELLLRPIIREEAGITPAVPAEKWRGGTLVLRPAAEGQQVNASDLADDVKVKLQSYVSGWERRGPGKITVRART
jgi:hypothetical protein